MDSNHKTPLRRDERRGRFLSKGEIASLSRPGTILTAEMGVVAESETEDKVRSRVSRWALLAVGAAVALAATVIPALALDSEKDPLITTQETFMKSCQWRGTAMLIASRMLTQGKDLTPLLMAELHAHTLTKIAEEELSYVILSQSMILVETCDQMWVDLKTVMERTQ
jgi:hypothetical protein